MRRKRVGALLGGVAFVLLLAVEPAAAQASANRELIWGLNSKLIYVAVPISILVEAILIYTVWKFRASNQEEASPTQENRRLEITWTVATAIILLFVGFASYQVLASPMVGGSSVENVQQQGTAHVSKDLPGATAPTEPNALEVEVIASKYVWTFHYPDSDVTSTNKLVVPTDRPVYLHVVSEDWLHSFHVPDLALKQDAFPGQYNTIKTELYETGTYQLYCAEYCGVGHSQMTGTVEVRSQDGFQQWIQSQSQSGSTGGSGGSANATATPA
ncbi:MAG: cytochrome c oxidase subunit II [Haloarculaceae archaeon]